MRTDSSLVYFPVDTIHLLGYDRTMGKQDNQPTVRQINAHVFAGTGSCYIDLPDGRRFRISRARTRAGVIEGKVIMGSDKDWETIPAASYIELL